jgi:hypothetical protein
MSQTFKTQVLKDEAIARQQEVVNNAQPTATAEAKAALAELKVAPVVA